MSLLERTDMLQLRPNSLSRSGRASIGLLLLAALILPLQASRAPVGAGTASPASQPTTLPAVLRVRLVVSDADRSIDFFTRVLDFEKVSDDEVAGAELESLEGVFGARCRHVRLRLGREEIELVEYLTPRGREIPRDSHSNDRWFQHIAIITSDMDKAYARLRAHKVRHASTGPQRLPDWNPNAGGIHAFYFHDPDDHVLEILQFPTGKGEPRWHDDDRLFLGIDHTAIVVADTEKSLWFYRDLLGLKVAGTSENWGTEQEHLNALFGARLRITTLRGGAGPGVELLEYLAPTTGRSYPPDAQANDLIGWETVLHVPSFESAYRTARERHLPFISSGIVRPPSSQRAFIVRDPDAHAVKVEQ
jgi:catechol 2,3-dioxygenase-like lactoylglutathione lyase family enzyme